MNNQDTLNHKIRDHDEELDPEEDDENELDDLPDTDFLANFESKIANKEDIREFLKENQMSYDLKDPQEQFFNAKLDENSSYPQVETVGILAQEFEEKSIYSEDEGIDDYKKGGYHPVHVGEVLNGRYVILQKLGWGHFSTVWLSRDTKFNTYVAIKL